MRDLVGMCHNRPSEAHRFGCGGLQAALQASPFACMEFSTICHLRWQVSPFASRKKSRLRRKKLRLPQTVGHSAYQGWHIPTCGDLPRPTLRGSWLWLRRAPSGASGCAFACMELFTICHLRWRICRLAARLFVLFHTTRKHITRHHTGSSIACYKKSPEKKCNVAEKRGALF